MSAIWLLICLLFIRRVVAQEEGYGGDDYEVDDPNGTTGSEARRARLRRWYPWWRKDLKADVLSENFFEKFITHFRNPAIHPCDNFYRHVCPISMELKDTYYAQVQAHGVEKLRQWGIIGTFNRSVEAASRSKVDPEQQDRRKMQKELRAKNEQPHEDVVRLRREREEMGDLVEKLSMIPDRVEFLTDALERVHGMNRRLPRMHNNLQDQMMKLVETFSREPNYEELYRQHVNAINELTIFFAVVDETLEQIDGLKALIDVTKKTFEHLKFTPDQWPDRYFEISYAWTTSLKPMIEKWASIQQLLAVGLRRIGSSNSGRYVSMSIWELMPVLVNPGADPAIALWPEKDCFSGLHTFLEDRSDFTGLRIAWEAFMVEVRDEWGNDGDPLKRLVYPDLGVTREQLFFYAQSIPYCSTYDRSQHIVGSKGRDVHSAHRIRVNMIHSNMEEFAIAFNCTPGDRMVQRPTCPYF
ncbi:unnamed protein product, partial [Mesorhabditis spiculigera]